MEILIPIMMLVGLFILSLVLSYPYKKLLGKKSNGKFNVLYHFLGWSLLLFSLTVLINSYGIGVGITYWFGYVTLMSLILVLFFMR